MTLFLSLLLFWFISGFFGTLTINEYRKLSTKKYILFTCLGLITIYAIVILVYRKKL
jgi:predicted membrane channel-forming protein YqfA (hemolysin III family)